MAENDFDENYENELFSQTLERRMPSSAFEPTGKNPGSTKKEELDVDIVLERVKMGLIGYKKSEKNPGEWVLDETKEPFCNEAFAEEIIRHLRNAGLNKQTLSANLTEFEVEKLTRVFASNLLKTFIQAEIEGLNESELLMYSLESLDNQGETQQYKNHEKWKIYRSWETEHTSLSSLVYSTLSAAIGGHLASHLENLYSVTESITTQSQPQHGGGVIDTGKKILGMEV